MPLAYNLKLWLYNIDMDKQDKVIVIGAIATALFLLYMIKPAPVNAFCYEWGVDLDERFADTNNKFDSNPSEEVATK